MRYIDADKLIAHLHSQAEGRPIAFVTMTQLTSSISFVEKISAADVAPKSEVAREIIEFIEGKIKSMEDHTPTEDLDRAIGLVNWILSGVTYELKKKYTEGKE